MSGRRGALSKMIGGGIGFAKEYSADRKARKESAQSMGEGDTGHPEAQEHRASVPGDENGDQDDEDWMQDLDEVQQEIANPNEGTDKPTVDELIAHFLQNHPPPPYNAQTPGGILSMPVIIPQRRPESRTRGFVQAYAPVLADAGIDQATWLEFLDGFQKAIKQNGWFHVANLAVAVAEKVRFALDGISIIAKVVVTVIHVSIEGGRRGYVHFKQNKYLDAMNEQFFMPRGLFCLIIKYKPSSKEVLENVDIEKNTTEQVANRDGQSKWKNIWKSAAGTTRNEEEIPEFAPLIFPALDNMDETQKESSVKHFGHFMQDYFDRQSQAKFDAAHPESKLSGVAPKKEFASAYSDPNSNVSKGNIVSVLTGGKVERQGPVGKLQERGNQMRQKLGVGAKPSPSQARADRKAKKPINKMLKQDALYLLVVNTPTSEEIDRVMNELNKASAEE